jgi:hypothetical protein
LVWPHGRSTLARLAGFPAINTLDGFGFEFAAGVPKPQILELASLAFIERNENVVLLGPSGARSPPRCGRTSSPTPCAAASSPTSC